MINDTADQIRQAMIAEARNRALDFSSPSHTPEALEKARAKFVDSIVPLRFQNRVCRKHGPYNQDENRTDEELWNYCDSCEVEYCAFDDYEESVERFESLCNSVYDAISGPFGKDERISRAFALLDSVYEELAIKRDQMNSELV